MSIARRCYGLLALLLAGSASILGKINDPFPDVNSHGYFGNMTMTVKAVMNGEVLTDNVIIAVYCGDEIRGKGCPEDETAPGVTYLTVYSDAPQKLFFKVAVGEGAIIEVDPGNITFKINSRLGDPDSPYTIEVPAPPITTTFSKEGWATTCLPFDACVPEGVTVWNATGISNSLLQMEEIDSDVLPANVPALLQGPPSATRKWGNAVADAERLAQAKPQSTILLGTTAATSVEGSVLTLGHSNEGDKEIGFWLFTGSVIPANRAYIADFPSGARIHVDVPVHVEVPVVVPVPVDVIYNLKGQKVSGRLPSGCYIKGGKKFIVK